MFKRSIICVCLALQPVYAADIVNTQMSERELIEVQHQAMQWRVTAKDWIAYQGIMKGPRGVWNKDADPILVLGAEAKSEADRKRFAEIYVQLEYDRVGKELAFQRAVTQAWKDVYPNGQRLATPPQRESELSDLLKPQLVALIVDARCCDELLASHIKRLRAGSVLQLDVYVINTNGKDEALHDFIASKAVPVKLIQANKLTINHGEQYDRPGEVWILEGETWRQQ